LVTLAVSAVATQEDPQAIILKADDAAYDYRCDVSQSQARYRGGSTFICFHIHPIGAKIVLRTKVDESTIFRIDGAFEELKDKTTQIDIIAQIQGTKNYSVAVPYLRNDSSKLVYPINILNINLKHGAIAGYTWQNLCPGGEGECPALGAAATTATTCKTERLTTPLWHVKDNTTIQGVYQGCNYWMARCESDFLKCDPRIVVNWSGTDATGKYMRSGNLAPAMFIDEAFTDFHSSMVDSDFTVPVIPNKKMEEGVKKLFDELK